jgi:hypothetical protein
MVGGTKRIVQGITTAVTAGVSGVLRLIPVVSNSFALTNGVETYTDNNVGVLTSNLGGSGSLNYNTGVWSINAWNSGTTSGAATYQYNEDIKSEYILEWILAYTKALVKQTEGNVLRAARAIKIEIDGQELVDEGKEEQKALEERLSNEGRWLAFIRKF